MHYVDCLFHKFIHILFYFTLVCESPIGGSHTIYDKLNNI